MKSISAPFIERPIASSLIALLITLAGILAFRLLPVSQLPQIEFPTILVQASLPGASPAIMASSVATPLERQLGQISGITEMTSSSTLGNARVILQFDLSRNIDGAARDVQAAIDAAIAKLPTDLPGNPTYRKVNPADAPIMIISLTSNIYSRGEMYDAASTILQQKISQTAGIGQVVVGGGSLPAVRVELNPTALNNYGISLDSVRTTIQNANSNIPKGQIVSGSKSYEIVTNDQIFKAYQYKPLMISYKNGAAVTLDQLGDVVDSVEDLRNHGLTDGKPSIVLILFKQPGANVIETVDLVKTMLPQLNASIPSGMDLTVTLDRTTTIRSSLREVEKTLVIAIALVVFIVFLFLKNIYATFIPSIAVPLSLLGTFAIMYLLNFSLDNLSLMALTISTGFVVDDAIVMLENISRHMEAGMSPKNASLLGAKEVGFTVLSMSISLIAVFIPILLMGGIIGRLFFEFAMTLSISIIVSLIVSLIITPSMCSQLLKPKIKLENNAHKKSFLDNLNNLYATSLHWSLNHKRKILIITIGTIILNIILFIIIPKGFFPQQDTGRIVGSIQADQNISFQNMKIKFEKLVEIIKQDPAVNHVVGYVGGGSKNSGFVFISLKSLEERKISADLIISRMRKATSKLTGVRIYMQAAQDLVIGGRQGNAQFQYTLSADTLNELSSWVDKIMQRLNVLPGIADINTDQLVHGLETFINVNHDLALQYGITASTIDNTLYDAFGQRQVSLMYKEMNQYHIIMEVNPKFWQHPDTLNNIYIQTNSGKVPLSSIAQFSNRSSLLSVNHQDQFPAATLSFNLVPGVALGDSVSLVEKTVKEMNLPPNIRASFQGAAKAFKASLSSEPYLILAAIITIYIILGILYESFIHPITILSTLPSAGVGAFLALILTGTEFSLISLIGIILLIGIVKKNAIMMIDFALQLKRNGDKNSQNAIYKAAIIRFRPIMMTTFAAILGAVPLAFGSGVGSEILKPLGISIIGGLIVSQILTLYTTPVIYLYFEQLSDWLRLKKLRIKGNRNNETEIYKI
ncbi:efflux RND transporter permease subunit [Fluviispira sanaruensis]|uniref:Multidrug transporter n=1 Tax=Fluviispira sanaruensis TaxID=2493639 RepID=A0A4P2VKB8_FLUSA|nr:efflux RND transporter permease subunit [Fluviispira sanaruensis]BBH53038.1 multidrug transporter [Fluviispira sanaruensis]